MSTWTSSLRLKGGVVGAGVLSGRIRLPGERLGCGGHADAGPRRPATDVPGVDRQDRGQHDHADVPQGEPGGRGSRAGRSGSRRPDHRSVGHGVEGSAGEAGGAPCARSLAGSGVGVVHREHLDFAARECRQHRARDQARRSLHVHSAACCAEAETQAEAEGTAEDRGHHGEEGGDPSRRSAPGRRTTRPAGRSPRPPRAR